MSLLALLASSGAPMPPHPAPYPTEAPWNAREPVVTPTPEGSGLATHPAVIDMGEGGWSGYRYWMAMTPYPYQELATENPCVLASDDGFTWVVPPGHTNPLRPWGGGDTWQSDTDIEYDPDTGRMWVIWRESEGVGGSSPPGGANLVAVWSSWSTNGYQWSTPAKMVDHSISDIPATAEIISPALVRRGTGDWWIFCTEYGDDGLGRSRTLTATSPTGPWASSPRYDIPGAGQPWHIDVNWVDGRFVALINDRGVDDWNLRASTSTDGLTWTTATPPIILRAPRDFFWDEVYVYRGSMTPDGDHFKVWYGGVDRADRWRIGHTRIPKSEFYTA